MTTGFSDRAERRDKKRLLDQSAPDGRYLVADFPSLQGTIVSATAGSAGAGSFVVAENFAPTFVPGFPFRVSGTGSAGDDGYYRVSSAGATYNSTTQQTTVPVNETVANSIAATNPGGVLLWDIPSMPVVGAVAGTSGSFSVSGFYSTLFAAGCQIDCVRSANNSGLYTLTAAPTYNAVSNQTTFTVSPAVPSGTVDGFLIPHYPAPHEGQNLFPACDANGISLGVPNGSQPPSYYAGSRLELLSGAGQYVPRGSLVWAQPTLGVYVPVTITPRQTFVFVGGGSQTISGHSPRQHSRLDPNTGAVLWTRDRGGGLYALAADSNGCCYTGGEGTIPGEATLPIVSIYPQISSANPYFLVDGNCTSTFTAGFAFTVGGTGAPDGSYTVASSSYVPSFGTYIFTNQTVNGPPPAPNTGTIGYSGPSGTSLEKWGSDGSLIWAVSSATVTAIAVDNLGFVYAGGQSGGVAKYDQLGNPVTLSGGTVGCVAPFAGLAINSVAVDPIDGRIAIAFGNLATPTPYGALYTTGQYQVALFTALGAQITGLNWQSGAGNNPGGNAFGQASCRFDLKGNLYTVGIGAAGVAYTVGWIFDYTGNQVNSILWAPTSWVSGQTYPLAHSVSVDGVGRALIGAQAAFNYSTSYGFVTYGPLDSLGALSGTGTWLFKLAHDLLCWSIAADRGGGFYAVCASPGQVSGENSAQVYAFDPLGRQRWVNNYWHTISEIQPTMWEGLAVPTALVAVG
jgi:hypothetical protein